MPVTPQRVSSGIASIDEFLGGGYPRGAITRVVMRPPSTAWDRIGGTWAEWDAGRKRLIEAALKADEHYAQYLMFPSTSDLFRALRQRQPDLLVIEGWHATTLEITDSILRLNRELQEAHCALLMFDNRENAMALRFFEKVRFSLSHLGERQHVMQCVKTVYNANQGHELVF